MVEEEKKEQEVEEKPEEEAKAENTTPEGGKKKKKKTKKEEPTAWWEWALIIAVLSYKCYTPLPENIEDRYPRSAGLFFGKAIYKVGHYIRIISPSTEVSYLRSAFSGIASLHHDVEGVTNDFVERNNFNLYVFTPEGVKSSANPAIFYIYGNGWSFADIEYYRTYLQNLAKETGSVVISPNYRQAPENAFPAPFEDCLEAANYVFGNAAALKIDPNNVVLSGDGTGATMALSLSLNMSEKKFKTVSVQNPATQTLLWQLPSQTLSRYFGLSETQTAWYWSMYVNGENSQKHRELVKGGAYLQAKKKHKAQFALADPFKYFDEANFKNPDGKNWNAPAGDFMAQEIPDWMPTTASKLVDYRAAPLFASDLLVQQAQETHFFFAGYDPLKDEGLMFAERLKAAGAKVHVNEQPTAFHADFVWSKYFSGYDLKMPSADAHAEEYFKHLKGLLN
ncbi:unnamed protein product [Oikopleura dioica]|uniref:Alpha/beta hydrolase fold-3 domain-containing protein n=2 Tax=Oikopleura dioica TaxID=34765 RepID=E4XPT6_OIKDI|nr:unnamed protein product [Oikopleura dioica]